MLHLAEGDLRAGVLAGFSSTQFGNRLEGRAGNDTLLGLGGRDVLLVGTGGDTLDGGSGDDRLAGGEGEDTLIGGLGFDQLTGGTGADVFRFAAGGFQLNWDSGPGQRQAPELITDFAAGVDAIDLDLAGGLAGLPFYGVALARTTAVPFGPAITTAELPGRTRVDLNLAGDADPEFWFFIAGNSLGLSQVDFLA